jgi:hypothetical protein
MCGGEKNIVIPSDRLLPWHVNLGVTCILSPSWSTHRVLVTLMMLVEEKEREERGIFLGVVQDFAFGK